MKRFYSTLLLFILLSNVVFAIPDDNYISSDFNFTKAYKNSAGTVIFYHGKHAERFLEECGFCHSALKTFGGTVNKLFAHKVCITCHESHEGPNQCNDCHVGYKAS